MNETTLILAAVGPFMKQLREVAVPMFFLGVVIAAVCVVMAVLDDPEILFEWLGQVLMFLPRAGIVLGRRIVQGGPAHNPAPNVAPGASYSPVITVMIAAGIGWMGGRRR